MLAASIGVGCAHQEGGIELPEVSSSAAREPAPVEVSTLRLEAEPIGEVIRATGHLRAARSADLGVDVVGRITEVRVVAGQHVEAGDVLVRLNAAHARAAAAQAEANANAGEAGIQQLQADISRLEPLVADGVVAGAELERLRSQLASAEANRRSAQAAITSSRSTLPSYELRAPFAGVVESVLAEVGEIGVAGGPVLVRLLDLATVEAELAVPETALPLVESSPTVSAIVRAYGETIEGRVVRIGSAFIPESHAAPVVVEFDNPTGRLRAGMFIEATLRPTSARRGLVVPAEALRGSDAARYAFVLVDGTVQQRPLSVAALPDGRYEVLSGLAEGDHVVTASTGVVHAGAAAVLAALDGGVAR